MSDFQSDLLLKKKNKVGLQNALHAEVEKIVRRELNRQKMSVAEAARKLNLSEAYFERILTGESNLTLRWLSDIFHMLGRKVKISLSAEKEK